MRGSRTRMGAKKPPPSALLAPQADLGTYSTAEMLTPSELEQLERAQKDAAASLQKAYPGLKVE